MNLSMFVIGKRRAGRDLRTEEDSDFGEVLATVLGRADLPAVSAALSASAFTDEGDIDWEQADFEFGLARMLDGYEVFIRTFET
ncbi:TetR/AcrR family transcriptional regulator C-terminal domain-containing protein [Nocardia rhizosphaerae]|uniref:TetR/AcrR family transcriptional regulator C-terminal domain-containing protein n=1 Tax=Nocardia rhizosphaerae TaxID=1691571 RepID=A0ABV8LAX4_9NOCA